MFDLDTRLLQIFFEIYKHSSVSKAAEQLEIGQPTLSIALNKLREHFQDPLLSVLKIRCNLLSYLNKYIHWL